MKEIDDSEKSYPTRKILKGTVLQRAGDQNVKLFYVLKGLLRSYIVDRKGKEHICMFAPEGWMIADAHLLDKKEYAVLYIDALEDSEVEFITEYDLDHLDDLDSKILATEIRELIRKVSLYQDRILILMASTASQRYQYFLETHANLTQRVSLKMIASYLGITPETLSVVRSGK